MKICYLGDNGSVHNQKWIQALSAQPGIEVHVICFNRGVKYEGVTYYFLKKFVNNKADYLLNIFQLKKLLRQIKPDVLHAQYATSYGFMAAVSGFHPLVVTGWGADIFDSPGNLIMRKVVKYSLRKADAISVLSLITLNEISSYTEKEVSLIPFGVDISKFIPARISSSTEKIRIGTIRTLSEKYGVAYLIDAFASLTAKYEHVLLDIVGDGELRPFLEQKVYDLGIADRVKFYGYLNQQIDFEKYYSILSRLDIFAILSILDSETFGVAAVEAEACGIPVVASNVGGLPEVVVDGETGLIVPPKNAKATADALERLIIDSDLRKQMGLNARKLIEERYDWNKSISKMISLYNSVIKSN